MCGISRINLFKSDTEAENVKKDLNLLMPFYGKNLLQYLLSNVTATHSIYV